MLRRVHGPALLIASLTMACAPQAEQAAPSTEADVEAINQVRAQEVAALSSQDTMLAYVTDDVVFMPADEPAAVGLAAVRSWARELHSQFRANVTYTATDVVVSGDWGIERYAATVTITPVAGGAAAQEVVKGLHIYRRQADGSWKMAYDIWNRNAPAPTGQ